ncbi:AAA family ATPase [Cronobacter sakazakii]|uniref:AAA family ATPase n=1 Tax=Cronobacter sakazakii TaxID=28141 RepID=UPI00165120F4|nr:AAA family ATPase [Cronobacter sakazakii]ELY2477219.1 AAA family ATPase [Cronobacter sakazakii]ELY2596106.1 AAA family ATPase [Cronobacter sakazakii]ELY2733970.1 AAA family ATPase [Cronobacter sakazakii]ELY6209479.1 AAA family ATPase [Cronobacter sakazakii]ELY6292732.1 AAA family ATPase [Cronobacter sakazakii]
MTISTTTESTLPARTGWAFRDTLWMLGVYGATVGAGTLFLPVEIGTRGPLVFLLLLVLGIPLSLVPHVLICRVFMRDNRPDDGTLPLFGAFFGAKGRTAIRVFFCVAHFPVTLVYAISLVNALSDYLVNRLHFAPVNRALLAFIVVAALFLALSKGRDKVVSMMGALALPFAVSLLLIAVIQIPAWSLANFSMPLIPAGEGAGDAFKNIWLTLPLISFALCSAPLIAPLASYYRESGHGGEMKSVRVVRVAYALIIFSIVFFVLSCLLANPPAVFARAKAENLNMLSVMQSQGGLDLLFMIAPFIAIVGMTKSFLGVCLPVAETITALVAGHAGMKKQAKTLAFLAMFIATFGVVDLNPDVITLIETVCGPLTAIFLFLIPTYLIYTRDALRSLRGPTAVMVATGGLLTVSALLYSTF